MLRPGNIVTDLEAASCYYEKQGLVVNVQLRLWEAPEVTVRFDRELFPYHLSDDECLNGIFTVYHPDLLRADNDWEPEVYARRLFKNDWHSLTTLVLSLNSEDPCMVEGCAHRQERTAWFNIWGTVCNAHLCEHHATHYHGRCGESFPWIKKLSA